VEAVAAENDRLHSQLERLNRELQGQERARQAKEQELFIKVRSGDYMKPRAMIWAGWQPGLWGLAGGCAEASLASVVAPFVMRCSAALVTVSLGHSSSRRVPSRGLRPVLHSFGVPQFAELLSRQKAAARDIARRLELAEQELADTQRVKVGAMSHGRAVGASGFVLSGGLDAAVSTRTGARLCVHAAFLNRLGGITSVQQGAACAARPGSIKYLFV
jgi:hypothetical protein